MTNEIDQTGIPTHQCFNCGGEWFRVYCRFENYEIAQYIIEATCVGCDSNITAPTLVDSPTFEGS